MELKCVVLGTFKGLFSLKELANTFFFVNVRCIHSKSTAALSVCCLSSRGGLRQTRQGSRDLSGTKSIVIFTCSLETMQVDTCWLAKDGMKWSIRVWSKEIRNTHIRFCVCTHDNHRIQKLLCRLCWLAVRWCVNKQVKVEQSLTKCLLWMLSSVSNSSCSASDPHTHCSSADLYIPNYTQQPHDGMH